jgi:glycosyltransferase involved in cell wall biosynthesis
MEENSAPLISVVIPTGNRCETLPFAIRSVLDQKSDLLELIVSDNFSSDRTHEVISEFKDVRIRCVRTDRRLSMCDHWDFALAYCRGRYVIVIGDDDALMPGAVEKLIKRIRATPSNIYKWCPHFYEWPTASMPARVTSIELNTEDRQINLVEKAKFAIRHGTWRHSRLPMVYHSAVSADLLKELKRKTGRIFHSTVPDVFTGFALAAVSPTAMLLGESLSVSGHSPASNGAFHSFKDPTPVQKFVDEYADYKLDPTLYPKVPITINLIPDAALKAMKLFDTCYDGMRFNYSAMWAFMERFWEFDGQLSLIRRRKDISKYHPFNPAIYLIYKGIHRLARWRAEFAERTGAAAKLERRFRKGDLARPNDVFECAGLLANLVDRDDIRPSRDL